MLSCSNLNWLSSTRVFWSVRISWAYIRTRTHSFSSSIFISSWGLRKNLWHKCENVYHFLLFEEIEVGIIQAYRRILIRGNLTYSSPMVVNGTGDESRPCRLESQRVIGWSSNILPERVQVTTPKKERRSIPNLDSEKDDTDCEGENDGHNSKKSIPNFLVHGRNNLEMMFAG